MRVVLGPLFLLIAFGSCGDDLPAGAKPDLSTDAASDTPAGLDIAADAPDDPPDASDDAADTIVLQPWGLAARPPNPTCVAPPKPPASDVVGLVPAFPGLVLEEPTAAAFSPTVPGRVYVTSKFGLLAYVDPGSAAPVEALDLTAVVASASDLGLVGLAFDPQFAETGALYLAYNLACEQVDLPGAVSVCPVPGAENGFARYVSRIARFVSEDGGQSFDVETEQVILDSWQPLADHTVNQLVFGPDGMLYVGAGDGGCCGDPLALGQDLGSIRGKILRIDVSQGGPGYTVPADNPFVGIAGARPEIWALGFRNPWKLTFDRLDHSLWVGDVGQDDWEEVNRVVKGGNYGWNVVEGPSCFDGPCDPAAFQAPIAWYPHDVGKAVIGGFVYRGTAIPALQGAYLFADFIGRQVWALSTDPDKTDLAGEISGPHAEELLFDAPGAPVAFIEDAAGEPYLVTYDFPGQILRIVPPEAAGGTPLPATLSATGCFEPSDPSQPVAGLIPYAPAAPFWSDGGDKWRALAIPDDKAIGLTTTGDFDFPEGSVLVKEFALDGQRIETRLFSRHDDGSWSGYTYRWRADASDADLVKGRVDVALPSLTWTIPSRGACSFCHTAAAGRTLGLETRQLDLPLRYPSTGITANQIDTLRHIGILSEQTAGEVAHFLRDAPVDSKAANALGGEPGLVEGAPVWDTSVPGPDGPSAAGSLVLGGGDAIETVVASRGEQTLSAWIAPAASSDVEYMESVIDSEVPGAFGTGFGLDAGALVVLLDDEYWETDLPVPGGEWMHVVLTWDDRQARLYLDGVLEEQLDYARGGITGAPYRMGMSPWRGPGFQGRVRDVRVIDATVDETGAALLFAGQSLPAPAPRPAYPDPYDSAAPRDERARAWLHTNCAQCHRPAGAGRYDLRFDTPLSDTGMCDVEPQHGPVGALNPRLIAPGEPERSVLARRIREIGSLRMPPVSSHVVDAAGVALIESWIASLPGCAVLSR